MTASAPSAPIDAATAEAMREERRARVADLAGRLRASQQATEALQEENYEAWDEYHGTASAGCLSYAEIAAATEWSRGWIILGLRKWREAKENKETTT